MAVETHRNLIGGDWVDANGRLQCAQIDNQ